MELLLNKVVAITGSSKGIGRACAHESAKQGVRGLILHYLGDETSTHDVKTLESEITQLYGTKSVIIDGDIAQQETSARVCMPADKVL
jgi:L-rhamnose 1-dehydrogenase